MSRDERRSRGRRAALVIATALLGTVAGCTVHATTRPVSTQADVVVHTPPPPPRRVVVRDRPAPPGRGSAWVEGRWRWNGHRYVWVSGHWVSGRSGQIYQQGRWTQRGGGWVWVEGGWVEAPPTRGSVTVRVR